MSDNFPVHWLSATVHALGSHINKRLSIQLHVPSRQLTLSAIVRHNSITNNDHKATKSTFPVASKPYWIKYIAVLKIGTSSLLSFRVLAHQITTKFHCHQENPARSATITELKSRFVAMTQMVETYWQITFHDVTGTKWNHLDPFTRKSNILIIIF